MEGQKIVYDILKIINEIKECYKNKCYFASISMLLILPDICSKIQYNKDKSSKTIYKNWCDYWFRNYLPNLFHLSDKYGTWGEILYYLRCSILHNGDNDVSEKDYKFFDLDNFNIYVEESEPYDKTAMNIEQFTTTGALGYSNKIKVNINLGYLISLITGVVYEFIEKWKLKQRDFPEVIIYK